MSVKTRKPRIYKVPEGTMQLAYALADKIITGDRADVQQMAVALRASVLAIAIAERVNH